MIRVKQVKVNILSDNILESLSKKLKVNIEDIINYNIIKKSIDARNKEEIYYSYELDVNLKNENKIKLNKDISISSKREYKIEKTGNTKLKNRPIIVGSGPCGLFCALILAEQGYNPLVIERGEKVEDRVNTVSNFWKTNNIDTESNVQFGEGGAGTFSDGKLNTMIKDENNRFYKVFKTFVSCGAKENILTDNNPHIGTDDLRIVVKNLRNKIISLGGEFKYQTKLTDIIIKDNKIESIIVNNKDEIPCDCLILAIGHSARDTFKLLLEKNINMSPKPFAIGLRVIHSQDMINENQYGKYKSLLPPASYKLTNQYNGRGIYSFCMCPGGYVINASSEKGYLAINGMSNNKRDSGFANSAIIVSITPNDFGNKPLDGVIFQQQLEKKAYELGKGKIPIQLLKDYYENKKSTTFGNIKPIFMSEYEFSNINELFPSYINEALKNSFPIFDKRIKGFASDDTVICGIESRTSSPVRIYRNEDYVSNIEGIYPGGEGAGYSGGITSSAVDGIKIAEKICSKFIGG